MKKSKLLAALLAVALCLSFSTTVFAAGQSGSVGGESDLETIVLEVQVPTVLGLSIDPTERGKGEGQMVSPDHSILNLTPEVPVKVEFDLGTTGSNADVAFVTDVADVELDDEVTRDGGKRNIILGVTTASATDAAYVAPTLPTYKNHASSSDAVLDADGARGSFTASYSDKKVADYDPSEDATVVLFASATDAGPAANFAYALAGAVKKTTPATNAVEMLKFNEKASDGIEDDDDLDADKIRIASPLEPLFPRGVPGDDSTNPFVNPAWTTDSANQYNLWVASGRPVEEITHDSGTIEIPVTEIPFVNPAHTTWDGATFKGAAFTVTGVDANRYVPAGSEDKTYTGVTAFKFYAMLDTYADWEKNDIKLTGSYKLVPLRATTYEKWVSEDNFVPGCLNLLAGEGGGPAVPLGFAEAATGVTIKKSGTDSSNVLAFNYGGKTITSVKVTYASNQSGNVLSSQYTYDYAAGTFTWTRSTTTGVPFADAGAGKAHTLIITLSDGVEYPVSVNMIA